MSSDPKAGGPDIHTDIGLAGKKNAGACFVHPQCNIFGNTLMQIFIYLFYDVYIYYIFGIGVLSL